jgi:hypothetical protein
MLVTGEATRPGARPYDSRMVRGARAKVLKNCEYIAQLAALLAFHRTVRARLAGGDPHRNALAAAAISSIADSLSERIRQLERFGSVLSRSAALLPEGGDSEEREYQRRFSGRLAGIRDRIAGAGDAAPHPGAEVLVRSIPAGGAEYVEWARGLGADEVASGVAWLEAVRDAAIEAPRRSGLV